MLFLTQVLPYPLDAGPKVRAYHMLQRLAARHEVTLVSFVRATDSAAAVVHLRTVCAAVHTAPITRSRRRNLRAVVKGLATGLPIVIVRDDSPELSALLADLHGRTPFDIIHADQTSMAGYGLQISDYRFQITDYRLQKQSSVSNQQSSTILDQHNAVHRLTERMADATRNPLLRLVMRREARALARFEADVCRAYDAVLTVTAEDRDQLLSLYPKEEASRLASKFTVVPICVDPAQTPSVATRAKAPGEAPTILHLGTMFWPPNVAGVLWFAREVLPLVHRVRPDARFVIVGKDPPPAIRALAAEPRIEVTGYVADPRPYLAEANAFVVPLHAGSGMRVKILDAWLWGLPIVSTRLGAEGIDTHPGQDILLADTPDAFAGAVVDLLHNPGLNARLRRAGRAWVESRYSYRTVYQAVDELYDRLLDHRI